MNVLKIERSLHVAVCVYKAEAKLIKYYFHREIDATVAENLKQHIWCPNNFFFH